MPTKLKPYDIFAEMAKVDLSVPVDIKKVDPKTEMVVGEMTENMMRLHRLGKSALDEVKSFSQRVNELGEAHRKLHDSGKDTDEGCDKFHREFNTLQDELDDLEERSVRIREMFAIAVQLAHPSLMHKFVGAREGNVLVSRKGEEGPSEELLSMLLANAMNRKKSSSAQLN